jgi:3-oxoacyl-[acyl-carrier protein] reductase
MADRLKGKIAVITGSGDGIGRAAALAMAAEGAKVVVNDIKKEAADRVVQEIKKVRGEAAAAYDSVATMAGGENIIKTAVKNFGRIDILVNNAGNFGRVPITEMTEAQWDSVIAVHLKGHFACSKYAVIEMKKQNSGRIINISSQAAFFASELHYCTAKAGILGFTSALSNELKDTGITVNAVMPSAKTSLFPEESTKVAGLPVKMRLGPEYVAPMIVYLASDETKGITGRYFRAGGNDVYIYPRLLRIPGGVPTVLFKDGMWTFDELSKVIPPLMGNG